MATNSLPDNGISQVIASGPGYIIVVDGTGQKVKRTGAKNWRNNNPGNIASNKLLYGAVGIDTSGGVDYQGTTVPHMLVFKTLADGEAARKQLVFGSNSKYINLSIQNAMERYAGDPVHHTINITNYVAAVSKAAGVPSTTLLSSFTPAQQDSFLAAISKFEGFKVGTITPYDGTATPPPTAPSSSSKPKPIGPQPVPPPNPQTFANEDVYADPHGTTRNQRMPTGIPSGAFSNSPDSVDVTLPLRNILHDYPSYTYGLSLQLLTADEYNGLVTGGVVNYIPARVLIASAGRYNSQTNGPLPAAGPGGVFNRSPYFSDDFYFEELTMTTVIGTNATSRNTNAVEMKFSIIEPYGMTMINRLLDQANDPEMNCDNYLDMVYLLQIDFFASDETGNIIGAIPGITKRIPIKITQMDITASVKGSNYNITAVPYNHSAFETMTVSVPANMEISASTIQEFFQSGGPENKSFADALNGWHSGLAKDNKVGVPDSFNFDIDPKIAQSSLTSELNSARDTAMAMVNDTVSIRQGNLGSATKDFNAIKSNMSINAGTSIDKVIDYAVRNSSFIQDQMAIPDGIDPQAYLQQKAQNAAQPLNWYKITPQITLGQFDPVRKIYARNVTYSVQPYKIYNVKSDVAPQGKATNFVKEYNYIYTGQNDDILNFDINFNTLYYTAQTAYRSALTSIYKTPDTAQTTGSNQNQNSQAYRGSTQKSNSVMPMVMKPTVYNAKARATGGSINAKSVAVADLEDSLMTLSAADMLNVQLTIIGDPQFIKQDDIYYTPAQSVGPDDPRLTPNGSLRTDYSEIYVSLLFKTPIDIDEDTGMMKFNNNYRTSVFSGLFRVLTVESSFKTGQFTQVLNLIRLPYQASYDYGTQPPPSTDERSDVNDPALDVIMEPPTAKEVADPPVLPTAEDSAQRSTTVALPAEAPVTTQEQKDLSTVNETAPTKSITDSPDAAPQAEPAATGPSPEKQQLQQQLADLKSSNADLHQQTDAANTTMETAAQEVDRQQARIDRLSGSTNPADVAKLEAAKSALASAQAQQAQAQETFLSLQKQNAAATQAEQKLQGQISTLK